MPALIGFVGQLPLHLPHLIDLDVLSIWFNDQDIGVKSMINFFTGRAMIAAISCL
jgi:hypothetical protein